MRSPASYSIWCVVWSARGTDGCPIDHFSPKNTKKTKIPTRERGEKVGKRSLRRINTSAYPAPVHAKIARRYIYIFTIYVRRHAWSKRDKSVCPTNLSLLPSHQTYPRIGIPRPFRFRVSRRHSRAMIRQWKRNSLAPSLSLSTRPIYFSLSGTKSYSDPTPTSVSAFPPSNLRASHLSRLLSLFFHGVYMYIHTHTRYSQEREGEKTASLNKHCGRTAQWNMTKLEGSGKLPR